MLSALAIGVIGILVLRIGVGIYLATAAGKAQVARQIESRLGLPIEVQAIRLGLRTSSVSLRAFDPNVSRDAGELFSVESASADVSLFDLLRGRLNPHTLDLKGVTITLRLDAAGKLLTPLPQFPDSGTAVGSSLVPTVQLEKGRITIRQENRAEFTVGNLDVTLSPQSNGEARLAGTIDDPLWAKWTITGQVDCSNEAGWLKLATNDGPLTMDRLGSIPFVPAEVWAHVRPDGRGAVDLLLNEGTDHALHYTVTIKPAEANLTLPDLNASLTQVTGLIRVAGAKLDLEGTRAELAGGTLAVDGGFDFGPEPTRANLRVVATGLDIQQLPEKWGLPRDIEGKLRGNANLQLLIHANGEVEPHGGGSGTIDGAKIRDIPVAIALRLVGNGKNYRFETSHGTTPNTPNHEIKSGRIAPKKFIYVSQAVATVPEQPKPEESTLDATVKLRNVEIGELLEKLNVKLGYALRGKVSAEVAMRVPLTHAVSQAAYQFTGKLSSPALQLEGLVIRDLSATVVYQNGKLNLSELRGTIDSPNPSSTLRAGTFRGTAVVERDPPGMVKANFSLEHIPLGEVLKAIPGWSIEVRGVVDGKAEFSAPYAQISDSTTWKGSAELQSAELVLAGRTTKDLQIGLELAAGTATIQKAKITIEGIPVTAEATLALRDRYAFSASVRTTGTDVTDLRKLIPEATLPDMKGLLETESRISGTASPFTFRATGRIAASQLTLARSVANQLELKWEASPEKLLVPELKATLFGGTITGSAEIPFAPDKGGKFALGFRNVDAAAATEFVPDFAVKITGAVTGSIAGTIVPAKPGQSRVGNLDITLAAPKLTVQGIPAERLAGKAAITSGVLDYRLEGETLGGSFEIKGSYPGAKPPAPGTVQKEQRGSFRITGLKLARLAPALGIASLAPLSGQLDVTFAFDNDFSAGSGRVMVSGLSWGASIVGRELTGVIVLQDGVLRLSEFSGPFAGGELRALAQVRLRETRRNYFSLALRSADPQRLLVAVPELREQVAGPVTLVIRGQFGREMRGSGTVSLPRGTIFSVPVVDLRIPFDWAMAMGGNGRLTIREGTVNTGTGRMEADLTVLWGLGARVDGQVRLLNVPLRTIVPNLGSSSLFGNGKITGRFDLSGSNVRSLDGVTGTLVATFHNTSVREIPLLQQTIPFLNVSGLSQPFQSGDVRGTLSKSVFRVSRLALVNSGAQVFAEGTISLAGRVEVSVVAHTGFLGPESRSLQLLGLRLPAFGPIPITLLLDVSDFLSNRTIRLTITGTTKDPAVHVNTSALLTEEAVRFFLGRYVLPAGAAGALGLGLESGSTRKK
jgi:uncharacterized protein involved in outer membrane biogenesis